MEGKPAVCITTEYSKLLYSKRRESDECCEYGMHSFGSFRKTFLCFLHALHEKNFKCKRYLRAGLHIHHAMRCGIRDELRMCSLTLDDDPEPDDGVRLLRPGNGCAEEGNFKGAEDRVVGNILFRNTCSDECFLCGVHQRSHLMRIEGGVDDGDAPVSVCAKIEGV